MTEVFRQTKFSKKRLSGFQITMATTVQSTARTRNNVQATFEKNIIMNAIVQTRGVWCRQRSPIKMPVSDAAQVCLRRFTFSSPDFGISTHLCCGIAYLFTEKVSLFLNFDFELNP
jgi:hypothetical protein